MGIIKKLKGAELVGWKLDPKMDVFPITATSAVYNEDNENLDDILANLKSAIGSGGGNGSGGGSSSSVTSGSLIVFTNAASDEAALAKLNRKEKAYPPTNYYKDINSIPSIGINDNIYISSGYRVSNTFSTDSSGNVWSIPVSLGGSSTSQTGADTKNYNYIYCRMNTALTNTSTAPLGVTVTSVENARATNKGILADGSGAAALISTTPVGLWTDHPRGVTSEYPYEYIAIYKYNALLETTDKWDWQATVLWSNYGHDGRDGDGYEYIFKAIGPTDSAPTLTSPYSGRIGENGTKTYTNVTLTSKHLSDMGGNPVASGGNITPYQEDDFIPSGWHDDPVSVSTSLPTVYVSTRKKTWSADDKASNWGAFSEPKIWTTLAGETTIVYAGVKEFYKATTSGDTTPDFNLNLETGIAEGWTANVVPTDYSETKPYLWNAQVIASSEEGGGTTYGQETIRLVGYWGITGAIEDIKDFYCATNSYSYGAGVTAALFILNNSWKNSYSEVTDWGKTKQYLWNFERFYRKKGDTTPIYTSDPHIIGIYLEQGTLLGEDYITVDLVQENANVFEGESTASIIASTRGLVLVRVGNETIGTTPDDANHKPYFTIEYDDAYSTQLKQYTSFDTEKFALNKPEEVTALGGDEFCSYNFDWKSGNYTLGILLKVYYFDNEDKKNLVFHLKQLINVKDVSYDLEIKPTSYLLAADDVALTEDLVVKIKKKLKGIGTSYLTHSELESLGTLKYSLNSGEMSDTNWDTTTESEWKLKKDNSMFTSSSRTIYVELRSTISGYEDGETITIARDGDTGDEGPGTEYIFYLAEAEELSDWKAEATGEIATTTVAGTDGKKYINNPNYISPNDTTLTDNGKHFQDNDFIPTAKGWTDDIKEVTEVLPIQYIAKRKLLNGVWSAFETPVVYNRYVPTGYSISIDNDSVLLDDNTSENAVKNVSLCNLHIYKGNDEITLNLDNYLITVKPMAQNNLLNYLDLGLFGDFDGDGNVSGAEGVNAHFGNTYTITSDDGIGFYVWRNITGYKGTTALPEGTYGIKYIVTIKDKTSGVELATIYKVLTIQIKDINDGAAYRLTVTPNVIGVAPVGDGTYTITSGSSLVCAAIECKGNNITNLIITNGAIPETLTSEHYGKAYIVYNIYAGNTLKGTFSDYDGDINVNTYNASNCTHYIVDLYIIGKEGSNYKAYKVDSETVNYTIKGEDGKGAYVMTTSNDTAVLDDTVTTVDTLNANLYAGTLGEFTLQYNGTDITNDTKTIFEAGTVTLSTLELKGNTSLIINGSSKTLKKNEFCLLNKATGGLTANSTIAVGTYSYTVIAKYNGAIVASKTFTFTVKDITADGSLYLLVITNDVWNYDGDDPCNAVKSVTSSITVNTINNGVATALNYNVINDVDNLPTTGGILTIVSPKTLTHINGTSNASTLTNDSTYSVSLYTFYLYYNNILVDAETIDCIKNGKKGNDSTVAGPGGYSMTLTNDSAIIDAKSDAASIKNLTANSVSLYKGISLEACYFKYESSSTNLPTTSEKSLCLKANVPSLDANIINEGGWLNPDSTEDSMEFYIDRVSGTDELSYPLDYTIVIGAYTSKAGSLIATKQFNLSIRQLGGVSYSLNIYPDVVTYNTDEDNKTSLSLAISTVLIKEGTPSNITISNFLSTDSPTGLISGNYYIWYDSDLITIDTSNKIITGVKYFSQGHSIRLYKATGPTSWILVDSETIDCLKNGADSTVPGPTGPTGPTVSGSGTLVIDPINCTWKFNYIPLLANVTKTVTTKYTFNNLLNGSNLSVWASSGSNPVTVEMGSDMMSNNTTVDCNCSKITNISLLQKGIYTWSKCLMITVEIYVDYVDSVLTYTDTVNALGLEGYFFNVDENGATSILSYNNSISSINLTAAAITSTISLISPNLWEYGGCKPDSEHVYVINRNTDDYDNSTLFITTVEKLEDGIYSISSSHLGRRSFTFMGLTTSVYVELLSSSSSGVTIRIKEDSTPVATGYQYCGISTSSSTKTGPLVYETTFTTTGDKRFYVCYGKGTNLSWTSSSLSSGYIIYNRFSFLCNNPYFAIKNLTVGKTYTVSIWATTTWLSRDGDNHYPVLLLGPDRYYNDNDASGSGYSILDYTYHLLSNSWKKYSTTFIAKGPRENITLFCTSTDENTYTFETVALGFGELEYGLVLVEEGELATDWKAYGSSISEIAQTASSITTRVENIENRESGYLTVSSDTIQACVKKGDDRKVTGLKITGDGNEFSGKVSASTFEIQAPSGLELNNLNNGVMWFTTLGTAKAKILELKSWDAVTITGLKDGTPDETPIFLIKLGANFFVLNPLQLSKGEGTQINFTLYNNSYYISNTVNYQSYTASDLYSKVINSYFIGSDGNTYSKSSIGTELTNSIIFLKYMATNPIYYKVTTDRYGDIYCKIPAYIFYVFLTDSSSKISSIGYYAILNLPYWDSIESNVYYTKLTTSLKFTTSAKTLTSKKIRIYNLIKSSNNNIVYADAPYTETVESGFIYFDGTSNTISGAGLFDESIWQDLQVLEY